jgi:hypothetical protein
MEMTDKEKEIYNKLNTYEKDIFEAKRKKNPDLSFQELLNRTKMSAEVDGEIDTMIKTGTQDPGIKIKDPKIQKGILERIADWYEKNAPHIWKRVEDSFYRAMDFLDDLIARGVKWIGDKIDDIIDWTADKIDDAIVWLIDIFR